MNLFRAKNKAHKLINTIFYFIIFMLGFILGGGNIEKIISLFNSII